jgi:hypothetical protein
MSRFTNTSLSRDPFARATLVRRTLPRARTVADQKQCDYCARPARFQYRWEGDAAPGRGVWSKPMCCVQCFRYLNGQGGAA